MLCLICVYIHITETAYFRKWLKRSAAPRSGIRELSCESCKATLVSKNKNKDLKMSNNRRPFIKVIFCLPVFKKSNIILIAYFKMHDCCHSCIHTLWTLIRPLICDLQCYDILCWQLKRGLFFSSLFHKASKNCPIKLYSYPCEIPPGATTVSVNQPSNQY